MPVSGPAFAVRPTLFLRHPARFDVALKSLLWQGFVDTVSDGDTYWILFHLGRGQPGMLKVRLAGCDAPELSTLDGQAALLAVRALLLNQPVLFQHEYTRTGSEIMSFDRYVCWMRFYLAGVEVDLTTHLVNEGLAVPWTPATFQKLGIIR